MLCLGFEVYGWDFGFGVRGMLLNGKKFCALLSRLGLTEQSTSSGSFEHHAVGWAPTHIYIPPFIYIYIYTYVCVPHIDIYIFYSWYTTISGWGPSPNAVHIDIHCKMGQIVGRTEEIIELCLKIGCRV